MKLNELKNKDKNSECNKAKINAIKILKSLKKHDIDLDCIHCDLKYSKIIVSDFKTDECKLICDNKDVVYIEKHTSGTKYLIFPKKSWRIFCQHKHKKDKPNFRLAFSCDSWLIHEFNIKELLKEPRP